MKSRAAMATVMGGAITAVAVIITDGVEVAAIIMVGGITVIGGDLQSPAHFEEAASGSGFFSYQVTLAMSPIGHETDKSARSTPRSAHRGRADYPRIAHHFSV